MGEERRDGRGRWSTKRKTAAAVLARQVLKKILRLASAFSFRPPFRGALREKKFKTLGISFLGLRLSFEPG